MDDDIKTSAEVAEADALPRRYEVHADGSKIEATTAQQKPMTQKSPAEWAYERLIMYLHKFEETLDNEHEVAMGFTGADAGVMRIEGMGYFDPDMLTFYGSDPDGTKTQLIQHVSQLNVMLRALPKPEEEKEPIRIGFQLAKDLSEKS